VTWAAPPLNVLVITANHSQPAEYLRRRIDQTMERRKQELAVMGFFDRVFGSKDSHERDARLRETVERVIEGTDPRLKAIRDARKRLTPAVSKALDMAHDLVARFPPCIEMSPDTWGQSPMLRAMFVRPADITNTLSSSLDLREFLDTSEALGAETLHCVVAATRVERTVLGPALEGDALRHDVVQKTVGFNDFRLVGFSRSEEELRARIEDLVVEGLVVAALRDMAENRQQRGGQVESYRQLLLTRLRLMEQGGAGLDSMLDSEVPESADIERLRSQLAENEAELAALKSGPVGLRGVLERVLEGLHNAESIIQPEHVSLRLNAMNIVVGPDVPDASTIDLIEFSTVFPNRPRRVAFLASFPRQAVVKRHIDFDAALRPL
jgi:hypothetical protein